MSGDGCRLLPVSEGLRDSVQTTRRQGIHLDFSGAGRAVQFFLVGKLDAHACRCGRSPL